jgi:hypothetical protein
MDVSLPLEKPGTGGLMAAARDSLQPLRESVETAGCLNMLKHPHIGAHLHSAQKGRRTADAKVRPLR